MTLFWIITAAMIVAALGLLAPTLLRRHTAGADATEGFNVEIAREHLAELVKQKDAGELSDEEFAQARQDLELALAQDLGGTQAPAAAPRTGGRWALGAAALVIPLITVPVYLHIGSPHLIARMPGNTPAVAGHGNGSELPPIDQLVDQLRQRLEANPDNAEGWFLLGRTYMRLQDYTRAAQAYERVVQLLPDDPAGLLSLADALTMRDGRRSGPRALELLQKALSIDPNSITALWLLGNAAADKGNTASALGYWQRAYPLLGGEPAMQAELGKMITRAGGELPARPAALPPISPTPPGPAPAAASPAEAVAGGASIEVEVALAPALMQQVSPTDTVFVLARAESGPPMPLAVARHQAAELPLRVTLSDAMAMMPTMKLSSFPRVKVSAKVSKSGQAGTQPGDLVATDVVVDVGEPPVNVQLLINEAVK
jgi:cytochrome c-type biogenesis protein CcmH